MFILKIDTDGAAFRSDYETDQSGDFVLDPNARQLRALLRVVSDQLEFGFTSGKLSDCNGNHVGEWSLKENDDGQS